MRRKPPLLPVTMMDTADAHETKSERPHELSFANDFEHSVDQQCQHEPSVTGGVDSSAVEGEHSTHTNNSNKKGVKHAGKKVLNVLRPWKSVKRRFTRNEISLSSDRLDYGSLESPRQQDRNVLLAAQDGSLRRIADSAAGSFRRIASPVTSRHNVEPPADMTTESIVATAEGTLRQVMLLFVAAVLGANFNSYSEIITRVAEYVLVAWLTCAAILWASAQRQQVPRAGGVTFEEQIPLLHDQGREKERVSDANGEKESVPNDSRSVAAEDTPVFPELERLNKNNTMQKVVHPSLDPFYVIDTASGARAFPNATDNLFPLDTDYFRGHLLVLIRTPDCDDAQAVKGTVENDVTANYLRDKQRRFEFQFQVKLKKVPTGRPYFACELSETIKIGMIQRAFVTAAMTFVKASNPNFHYSLMGTPEKADGRWEPPHMAFPVEEGFNIMVTTPPGQKPPVLGQAIHEDEASIKQRKKGINVEWNTVDTYTFALWSAYCDFLDWRCLNLPGIRPFNLSSVIGPQPIVLKLYEYLPDEEGDQKKFHYRANTIEIVKLEMSNAVKSGIGPATRKWLADNRATPTSPEQQSMNAVDDDDAETCDGLIMNESADELCYVEDEQEEDQAADFRQGETTLLSEEAADELGEGIYVRSGDTLSLRESVSYGEDNIGNLPNSACFVANGGGFAVLQEGQTSSMIIIQKAGKSRVRKNARSSSRLIKSGDTVIFKLVVKGRNDEVETKYLSIHRGWWLKWQSSSPTKNGYFQVHTHETEFADIGDEGVRSEETQSAYLTLGGSFWLRHKRWSRYRVGIATHASATYGGRMLGLHIPTKHGGGSTLGGDNNVEYQSDDGARADLEAVESGDGEENTTNWMKPLQLQAFESGNAGTFNLELKVSSDGVPTLDEEETNTAAVFSVEHQTLDVPAWVEVLDRNERTRQHAYVVRVLPLDIPAAPTNEVTPLGEGKAPTNAFIRLRTGRDLAQVMRLGLKWRNSLATPRRRKQPPPADYSPSSQAVRAEDSSPLPHSFSADELKMGVSFHSLESSEHSTREDEFEFSDEEWEGDSDDLERVDSIDELSGINSLPASKRHGKGRKLIGKVARSVKTKTSSAARATGNAGKKVVTKSVKGTVSAGKATVNAGKATVSAGKAMIPIRPKKPPIREPKSGKKDRRRRRDSGLHVDVNSRSIRRVEQWESHSDAPMFLAGELSAPEQSRRTVSSMISKMSAQQESSEASASFSVLLTSLIASNSELDASFLQGGAVEIGVTPNKRDSEKGLLVVGTLVARCLWESHWREEWCGLYENGLVWYAPLTNTPCLELSFLDIKSTRFLDPEASPLAGYPLLVVETAWTCHYMAFASMEARLVFHSRIEAVWATATHEEESAVKTLQQRELLEIRFWQGFETSILSSQSVGGGKWAPVASGSKMKTRAVLNTRCMVFDLPRLETGDLNAFAEDLLSTALSFSLDSLKEHPEAIIEFLVSASNLRTISLDEINFESPEAYCLLVNLYHCLLQHALLFSVNGLLHKKSFNHFMKTSCYEIGSDVFSLAELYSCIIRGNMAGRPPTSKPPFIDAPKKSNAYRFYALGFVHPNTNFLLNTANASWPRAIPVLNPVDLERQLDSETASYIRQHVTVDKKVIFLPKIFEVYKNDFSPDNSMDVPVLYCLRYLEGAVAKHIRVLLDDPSPLTVKFLAPDETFYSSLQQKATYDSAAFQLNF